MSVRSKRKLFIVKDTPGFRDKGLYMGECFYIDDQDSITLLTDDNGLHTFLNELTEYEEIEISAGDEVTISSEVHEDFGFRATSNKIDFWPDLKDKTYPLHKLVDKREMNDSDDSFYVCKSIEQIEKEASKSINHHVRNMKRVLILEQIIQKCKEDTKFGIEYCLQKTVSVKL